jgi:CelD/BcsL family acetyltransferase involved in cellulose biosynthesis
MGKLQLAGRVKDVLRTLMPVALNIHKSSSNTFPLLERNGLVAQCHRAWPEDPKFLVDWNALLARNPWAMVFRGPIWQCTVVNDFVPAGHFRLITVYRDQQLLAIVPFAFNSAAMLETPGRWVSDFLDPLMEAGTESSCWDIILELLVNLWDWSVSGIHLPHIREDSILRTILPELSKKYAFVYEEVVFDKAPYIPLPATWEEYLASLDSHERKEIKRKIRNAETKANSKWLTLTNPDEVSVALERALAAMRLTDGNKGDFTDEILVGFLRRLCPQLNANGDFFIHELWLEGKPVAWLLALNSYRGPMMYNTAYDAAARQWSPGIIAFSLAIKDAIAAKHPSFNLLRGGEQYKKRLGAIDLDLFKVTLRPK